MSRARRNRYVAFSSVAALALAVAIGLVWLTRTWRAGPPPLDPRAETPPVIEPVTFGADGLALPRKLGSLRFAVVGDVGRGDPKQYDTAAELSRWRQRFDFAFVLMLGDNMYAAGTPEDYAARFERPYKTLLDAGVVFHAARGNHDPPGIVTYAPYNMQGNRYYSFIKTEGPLGPVTSRTVRFVAIDTVNLDTAQLTWLQAELAVSTTDWEICFYHHPLYTSGRYAFAGARLRRVLEPIFVQYGVDVGLAGHEHFYERVAPQRGIVYFTSGAGGALRVGDIRPSSLTATGFDTDTHFLLMEISGDDLFFQAISRTGQTVDSGRIRRRAHPRPPPSIGK
jgi:hypothetical protein